MTKEISKLLQELCICQPDKATGIGLAIIGLSILHATDKIVEGANES